MAEPMGGFHWLLIIPCLIRWGEQPIILAASVTDSSFSDGIGWVEFSHRDSSFTFRACANWAILVAGGLTLPFRYRLMLFFGMSVSLDNSAGFMAAWFRAFFRASGLNIFFTFFCDSCICVTLAQPGVEPGTHCRNMRNLLLHNLKKGDT